MGRETGTVSASGDCQIFVNSDRVPLPEQSKSAAEDLSVSNTWRHNVISHRRHHGSVVNGSVTASSYAEEQGLRRTRPKCNF